MITAPIIIFDETDKYPHLVGKEGDVFGLGNARRRVFPYTYKTLKISTPTTSDGPIASALREEPDEVRRFHLCCPRCGEFQPARFSQLKWPADVRDHRIILRERLAWYQCAGCEAKLDDTQRDAAVRLGEWQPCLRGVFSTDAKERAEAEALPQPQPLPEPRTVGWQIPAMLSHFVPLAASAAEFLKTLGATNRKAALMKFANQEEGLPYDELVKMEAPGEEALLRFRDPALPAQTVPEWADFLIASFDMQQVGFWFEVWAVEKHPQHPRKALIHYGRLATWEDLETLAFEGNYPIRGEPGSLGIWRAGIDTGGTKEEGAKLSRTQEVYLWLRAKGRGRVFGMKGEGRREGQPKVRLSVHDRGAPGSKPKSAAAAKRKGLVLWLVDSPRFKDDIFAELSATLLCPALECSTETDRWAVGERGGLCPACGADIPHSRPTVVLHADVGSDWAKQMLAEAKHRQKDGSFEWVREKPDNHYLDCTVNAWALISPEAGGVLKAPRRPRGAGPASPRHPAAVPPGQRSPRFTFR